jgi:predicted  nucleic acid-binding Zn-ribbon protein
MKKKKCYHDKVIRMNKNWKCENCGRILTQEEKRQAWKEYDTLK